MCRIKKFTKKPPKGLRQTIHTLFWITLIRAKLIRIIIIFFTSTKKKSCITASQNKYYNMLKSQNSRVNRSEDRDSSKPELYQRKQTVGERKPGKTGIFVSSLHVPTWQSAGWVGLWLAIFVCLQPVIVIGEIVYPGWPAVIICHTLDSWELSGT